MNIDEMDCLQCGDTIIITMPSTRIQVYGVINKINYVNSFYRDGVTISILYATSRYTQNLYVAGERLYINFNWVLEAQREIGRAILERL